MLKRSFNPVLQGSCRNSQLELQGELSQVIWGAGSTRTRCPRLLMPFLGRSPKKTEENLDFSFSPKLPGWGNKSFPAAPDRRAGVWPWPRLCPAGSRSWPGHTLLWALCSSQPYTSHQSSLVPGPSSAQENILDQIHVGQTPPKIQHFSAPAAGPCSCACYFLTQGKI